MYIAREKQSCFDVNSVNLQEHIDMVPPGMVVVPKMIFSCNGRIIGFMINLTNNDNYHDSKEEEKEKEEEEEDDDDDDNKSFPSIQVWRPLNFPSSDSYTRTGQYELSANDLNSDGKLANVSLPVNKRLRFQSGDIIGYYVPDNPSYSIMGIQTKKNTSFTITTDISLKNFTINDSVVSMMQPMIQVFFGNGIIGYSN